MNIYTILVEQIFGPLNEEEEKEQQQRRQRIDSILLPKLWKYRNVKQCTKTKIK